MLISASLLKKDEKNRTTTYILQHRAQERKEKGRENRYFHKILSDIAINQQCKALGQGRSSEGIQKKRNIFEENSTFNQNKHKIPG